MRRHRILVAGLICGLIISLASNVSVAWQLMKSQELYCNLSRDYDELLQSYDELLQSYDELKGIPVDVAISNDSYSPSKPPIILESDAIDIALEYGGWNETSLEGMEVSAALEYYCIDGGMTLLHGVTGHIVDFHPRTVGNATFRYLWSVIIREKGSFAGRILPYYVDAATGEVLSYDDTP